MCGWRLTDAHKLRPGTAADKHTLFRRFDDRAAGRYLILAQGGWVGGPAADRITGGG